MDTDTADTHIVSSCTLYDMGGGETVTMTKQPFDFPDCYGRNDHNFNTIGITKWSWSNGQNYQCRIIDFDNFIMVIMTIL